MSKLGYSNQYCGIILIPIKQLNMTKKKNKMAYRHFLDKDINKNEERIL